MCCRRSTCRAGARALPENLLTRRRDQAVSARSRSITSLSLDNKADLLPSTHSADHDLRSLPRNPPKTPHQSLVFARVFRPSLEAAVQSIRTQTTADRIDLQIIVGIAS